MLVRKPEEEHLGTTLCVQHLGNGAQDQFNAAIQAMELHHVIHEHTGSGESSVVHEGPTPRQTALDPHNNISPT